MFNKPFSVNQLSIFSLFVAISIVSYFNRWIFSYKFEPEYWENYYYESQWNVPNSKRIISDEGVYRYVGYRLSNGENPFNVDYWVPPLGKFWYGWAAKYLNNPYLISYFYYLISIIVFWFLAKNLIDNFPAVFLSTLLFALNPLLVEQIGQTMLDLPMTIFFMLTILSLLIAARKKNSILVIFSGTALGLMAGTKPPYFIPMIILISLWWLHFKKIKNWWLFLLSVGIGYLLAYTCYFLKHPNPFPFIRLHQKIIEFQKNNKGSHDVLNIFKVIFLGRYKGHWIGAKTIFPQNWSIVLPLGTVGLGWIVLRCRKFIKGDGGIFLLSILGLFYILMNFAIDFWPRYLMPLLPIFVLTLGYLLKNRIILMSLLLLVTLPSLYLFLFQSPDSLLEDFKIKTSNGFYRDTYRMLDSTSQRKFNEYSWKMIEPGLNEKQYKAIKENNQWKILIN